VSDELLYLYAIADAAASGAIVAARLTGIDGGRVAPVVEGRLLGATSVVPASEYDEAPLNEHLQDLDWLAPRAAAHQDVNGRLLEITGGIVPLAFGAIYRGPEGVRTLLEARDREYLREVARNTWSYFSVSMGESGHWLPPDNIQEKPARTTAAEDVAGTYYR